MTTLFLDIDGVLNNKISRQKYGQIADFHSAIHENRPFELHRFNFDTSCVRNLNLLITQFKLDVIISSTWRMWGAKPDHFIQLFNLYDIRLKKIDMIDTSLEEDKPLKRSEIIKQYVIDNNIIDFIMIDDTLSHYNCYLDCLVLTDDNFGFDADAYTRASILLEKITHKA